MKKTALLIGINNYLYFENSLKGCVNDVEIMSRVLQDRFGFDKEDITLLTNEKATRDSIIEHLKRIVQDCEPDDTVIFHFSGHGTRRISTQPDMPDGFEETIMTYDTGFEPHLNRDIRDSDFLAWLSLLTKKTTNVHLFFDSCHSGSITRGEQVRGIDTDFRETSLLSAAPPVLSNEDSIFPESTVNWLSLSDSYSLLTACRKDEVAIECKRIENNQIQHYGAFTYFLVQELRHTPDTASYQDVFEQLRIKMQSNLFSQNPQIEGRSLRRLFTNIDTETMKYVLVEDRQDKEITISGGAVHGFTVGSVWGIYPPRTKLTSSENKFGSVEIISVGAISSRAVIRDGENTAEIEKGCRAVEEKHYYEDFKKFVYLDFTVFGFETVKKIIIEDLKASSWVILVDSKDHADFIISLTAVEENSNDFEVKVLHAADGQTWLRVTDVDGLLKIRQTLERLVRYSVITGLENRSSSLNDLVEFNLLQQADDGKWKTALRIYDNLPVYLEDEKIAFQVINNSLDAIYVTVLDMGLSKRIQRLYPGNAASERVGSKRAATEENPNIGTLQVGVLPQQAITLYIPDTAFLKTLPDISKKGGMEIFKLIATTVPTDFRFVEQDGIRSLGRGFNSPLEELLYKYSTERQTRETTSKIGGQEDWIAINHAFYLRRR